MTAELAVDRRGDWDMTSYFPSFDGTEYRAFRSRIADDTDALQREVESLPAIAPASTAQWADFLSRLEDVSCRSNHLAGYLGCLGAADSRDEDVGRETSSAAAQRAGLQKVFVAVRAALRAADDDAAQALEREPAVADVRYFVERLRQSASWSMSAELESLAADLDVTGLSAWGRLYDQVSGKLEFTLEVPGEAPRRLPVSATRSLLESPDAGTRRAALDGANAAWEGVADVVGASLNAIAGTRHTLYARRGIDHFLEPALFDAGISRGTLDALLDTVTSRQEVARRYLRHKAKLLGRERLGFQDLMAPLPKPGDDAGDDEAIPWEAGRERVLDAFQGFYPDLRDFAAMAFDREWIDWRSRPGKRPGGFCSSSSLIGESRVFITYNETLGDLSTLAHELGHAFHGWLMRDMRPWARRYPMTLAETASTFAEQLVIDAVLGDPDAPARARDVILDSRMQDAATFLLNIPMRFQFEHDVYEERRAGELSTSRFCELMIAAQKRRYGDTLFEDELDPWFWASKLHFYITGISFYNFPYTFGYLFSLGIFARAREEGPGFLPRYEEMLRRTGSAPAEDVARDTLGIDLTGPAFWNASIDLIEAELERFEKEVVPG